MMITVLMLIIMVMMTMFVVMLMMIMACHSSKLQLNQRKPNIAKALRLVTAANLSFVMLLMDLSRAGNNTSKLCKPMFESQVEGIAMQKQLEMEGEWRRRVIDVSADALR